MWSRGAESWLAERTSCIWVEGARAKEKEWEIERERERERARESWHCQPTRAALSHDSLSLSLSLCLCPCSLARSLCWGSGLSLASSVSFTVLSAVLLCSFSLYIFLFPWPLLYYSLPIHPYHSFLSLPPFIFLSLCVTHSFPSIVLFLFVFSLCLLCLSLHSLALSAFNGLSLI